MKTTKDKKILSRVDRLSKLNKALKALTDEQAEIKNELKATMAKLDTNILAAGEYVLVISDRERKDLDKEMVQRLLGDKYEDCLKKSAYQIFEIKKA